MDFVRKIREFIDSVQEDLEVVLQAEGCREGWLQGEMYKYFRGKGIDFVVNCFKMGVRRKADIYFRDYDIIGEIKIFGNRGYYSKNINGRSAIGKFIPTATGGRVAITENHLARINEKEGSILKDVLRLKSVSEVQSRWMVLIIYKNGKPDAFGTAINAIKISELEWTFEYDSFRLRIWQI